MNSMTAVSSASTQSPGGGPRNERLWKVAQDLEASFLAEMLKSAGLGQARDVLGGDMAEDQFSSFLVREYADATTRAGGIGLSESIYRSLARQEGSSS